MTTPAQLQRAFSFLDASLDWMFVPQVRVVPESAWAGHVPFATWLIQTMQPGLVVELGTHTGTSFFAFCEAARVAGLETRCVAVDTWQGDDHAGRYGEDVFRGVVQTARRYGDAAVLVRKRFDEALVNIADGSVDVLHIDGLHTYEAAKHDFESWQAKLSPAGVVLFHDTAVRDRGFGVYRLLDELRSRYPVFEFMHSHGLGVVQVGPEPHAALKALCGAADALAERIRSRFSTLAEMPFGRSETARLHAALMQAWQRINELEAEAKRHLTAKIGQP